MDKRENIVKQMLDFLPEKYLFALQNINISRLYEIRMRIGKPTAIRFDGKYTYLSNNGVSNSVDTAIISTKEDLEATVLAAGKYSIYSVENELRQGFITAENGVRIGIAGRYIFEDGQSITVRDFTSLCIRVPHQVIGCSNEIYEKCFSKGLFNLLIVSAPGQGKTTILRDLCRVISNKKGVNILICDERGEIAYGDIGNTSDVFSFADKSLALEMGIRIMNPKVIVTDELSLKEIPAIIKAKNSGVNVISSIHATTISEVPKPLLDEFDIIVLLDSESIGKIAEIYKINRK